MTEMAEFTIYKITNRHNGKVYIGKTTRTIEARWKQHCRDVDSKHAHFKLQQAIKEFGADSFDMEQIDFAATTEEANEKEMSWIKHYDSVEKGYNTSPGGKNGGRYKKVEIVETGQVYDSMVEAAP